jgi:lipopolysaccharide export system protein LptA
MNAKKYLLLAGTAMLMLSPVLAKQKSGDLILKSSDSMENTMVNGNLVSELSGHVVFEYDDAVIKSDYAKWWRDEGLVDFTKNVLLTRPHQVLQADRMHYEREKKTCTAYGKLLFIDQEKHSRLTGQQGFYNLQTRYFKVQGDPQLVRHDSAAVDTLCINGKTMTFNDSLKCATVLDNVVINKGGLNARCQQARYYSVAQRANLRVKPFITYKANTLTGDSVDLIFLQDTLRGVAVKGNGNGRYREYTNGDSLVTTIAGDSMYMSMTDSGVVDSIRVFRDAMGKYYNVKTASQVNEASGKSMVLCFGKNGDVEYARVWDNAKSTYYVEDEDSRGKNIATGDTIHVNFANGKAERVRITGSVRGSYIPEIQSDSTKSAPKNKKS